MAFNSNSVTDPSDNLRYPGTLDTVNPDSTKTYSVQLTASQDSQDGHLYVWGDTPGVDVRPTVNGDVLVLRNIAGITMNQQNKERPDSGQQYSDEDARTLLTQGYCMLSASAGAVVAGEPLVLQVNGGTFKSQHRTGSLSTGEYFIPGLRAEESAGLGGVFQASFNIFTTLGGEFTGSL